MFSRPCFARASGCTVVTSVMMPRLHLFSDSSSHAGCAINTLREENNDN